MAIITRDDLFAQQASGAKWDVAVAIKRGNPLPLDDSSIFKTYEEAANYAATSPIAYPTQIVAVVNADGTNSYYGITQQGTLENVKGSEVDNLSIVVDNKKLSLKDFGKQYYKYIEVLESVNTVDELDQYAAVGTYCKVGDVWYTKQEAAWEVASTYPEDDQPYLLTEGFAPRLEPKVKETVDESGQKTYQLAWYERSSYDKIEVDKIVEDIYSEMNKSTSWGDPF